MIQRVQSLYLLLATIALILTYFYPYCTVGYLELRNYHFIAAEGMVVPDFISWHSLPLGVSLILHMVILFSFKNRIFQIRMIRYNEVLILSSYVFGVISIYKVYGDYGTGFHAGIATWMLVLALVFNQMARRAIRKDEALVKSVDRIR